MNMGVSFLPGLYVKSEIPEHKGDLVLLPFRKGRFARSIGIAWRKKTGKNNGFLAFSDFVNSVAKDRFAGLVQIE